MPLPVLQLVFFGTFQILRVELLNATRQFEVVKEQKQVGDFTLPHCVVPESIAQNIGKVCDISLTINVLVQ